MKARSHRGGAVSRIAWMNGRWKIVAEGSSVDECLYRAESDGIVKDGLIGREPALHFDDGSIGQVLRQIRDKPPAVFSANIVAAIMKGLELTTEMALQNRSLSLGVDPM
jgi:hypothetical protein